MGTGNTSVPSRHQLTPPLPAPGPRCALLRLLRLLRLLITACMYPRILNVHPSIPSSCISPSSSLCSNPSNKPIPCASLYSFGKPASLVTLSTIQRPPPPPLGVVQGCLADPNGGACLAPHSKPTFNPHSHHSHHSIPPAPKSDLNPQIAYLHQSCTYALKERNRFLQPPTTRQHPSLSTPHPTCFLLPCLPSGA